MHDKTTEDLLAEAGAAAELLPAEAEEIEPYEGATQVDPGQPDGPEDAE